MAYTVEREMPPAPIRNTPGMCPARYTPSGEPWDFLCCDKQPHADGAHHDPLSGPWRIVPGDG